LSLLVFCGTAEAVPFPFVVDHSSWVSRRRGKPRHHTSGFSGSCEAVLFPESIHQIACTYMYIYVCGSVQTFGRKRVSLSGPT
jgi:hypothetical protein